MAEKEYKHSIDVEEEDFKLYFATDDEEVFKNMEMFIGTKFAKWWW